MDYVIEYGISLVKSFFHLVTDRRFNFFFDKKTEKIWFTLFYIKSLKYEATEREGFTSYCNIYCHIPYT